MLRLSIAMTFLTLISSGCNKNHRYQESFRNYELGLAPPEHSMPVKVELPLEEENLAMLKHGKKLYLNNCLVCHGITGKGDGIVTKKAPALAESLLAENVIQKNRVQVYEVITNGQGKMLPFKAKLGVQERWALASYVKALQLSRHFPVSNLDAADREKLP